MGLARSGSAQAAQRERKARGGGDARTSLTASNAAIAVQPPCGWAFGPRSLRVPVSRGHLLCCRSSTMSPHRLRRSALHLPARSQERGPSYYSDRLLDLTPA